MSTKKPLPRFPTSVTLLGARWSVVLAARNEASLEDFGETDYSSQTITLFTDPHQWWPAKGSLRQTLLHECIHAALATSGHGELVGEKQEEALTIALEQALHPLIQQGVFNDD